MNAKVEFNGPLGIKLTGTIVKTENGVAAVELDRHIVTFQISELSPVASDSPASPVDLPPPDGQAVPLPTSETDVNPANN